MGEPAYDIITLFVQQVVLFMEGVLTEEQDLMDANKAVVVVPVTQGVNGTAWTLQDG